MNPMSLEKLDLMLKEGSPGDLDQRLGNLFA
jgi:hypothetical protein